MSNPQHISKYPILNDHDIHEEHLATSSQSCSMVTTPLHKRKLGLNIQIQPQVSRNELVSLTCLFVPFWLSFSFSFILCLCVWVVFFCLHVLHECNLRSRPAYLCTWTTYFVCVCVWVVFYYFCLHVLHEWARPAYLCTRTTPPLDHLLCGTPWAGLGYPD